jgi:hypothetical protein
MQAQRKLPSEFVAERAKHTNEPSVVFEYARGAFNLGVFDRKCTFTQLEQRVDVL